MTRQIVIKLNEDKFKPLLDKLKTNGHGAVNSYSELVGKIIFFDYLLWTEKSEELGNKTKMEFLLDKLGSTKDELTVEFLQKYIEFAKSGLKCGNNSENKESDKKTI